MNNNIRRACGMTLIEMLIVVAIIAILGAIAYPNYSNYQERARRTDAKSALQQVATMQERFYITNHTYTDDLTKLGFAGNTSESGHYLISVPVANGNGFQAVAVPAPVSPQINDDDCQQFTIDNLNVQGAAPDPDGDCW